MKYLILLLAIMLCSTASADVLMIERLNSQNDIELPNKGMSMNQVESNFGVPAVKNAPIGSPPITKWEYQKFTVYFEHQHVIHAVIHKATANEKEPKPID